MQAENWISITIGVLNYGILLEKNSFRIQQYIQIEEKCMRITRKGLASLNYILNFQVLCMPKIIPFASRISLLYDLFVFSVQTSLPKSLDASDDLAYILWFVQFEIVWSPRST